MHRKPNFELILLDTEIERTLGSLRKTKRVEEITMAENHIDRNEEGNPQQRTLAEFWKPATNDNYSGVRLQPVDANNFELKPTIVSMVQQHQFGGHSFEDPNGHLVYFLELAHRIKVNGVPYDVIKMSLFPFSLKDKARSCYQCLP